MLLACSGWACSRLISVTNIRGGNPVALRDPEHFAVTFRICTDCHQNVCDLCLPSGDLFAPGQCIHCGGKLVDGRRLAKVEATAPAAAVELRDRGYDAAVDGKLDDALREFEEAIRLRPEYVQAHFDRGVALNLLGRRADALAAFEQVIRLHPGHVQAMFDIGGIHRASRDLHSALAAYDRALAVQPRYTAALVNKAVTLHDLDLVAEAIDTVDDAIRIIDAGNAADQTSDVRATAFGVKGAALLKLARYAEAVEAMDSAIADGLDDRLMHHNRATALEGLGLLDEAGAARRTAEQRPRADG